MRIHARERLVTEAEIKITTAILDAIEDLTEGEQLRAVNAACGTFLASMAKYMIRDERHGNTDKPGGLE